MKLISGIFILLSFLISSDQIPASDQDHPILIQGATVHTVSHGTMQNSDKFIVPKKHYFFMGDNRDCSKDSRFLSSVGYVTFNNLVGRARLIFFSSDKKKGNFFKFWKWHKTIRIGRFFNKIQ